LAELERVCGEKGIKVINDHLKNDKWIFREKTNTLFIDSEAEERHIKNCICWLKDNTLIFDTL